MASRCTGQEQRAGATGSPGRPRPEKVRVMARDRRFIDDPRRGAADPDGRRAAAPARPHRPAPPPRSPRAGGTGRAVPPPRPPRLAGGRRRLRLATVLALALFAVIGVR